MNQLSDYHRERVRAVLQSSPLVPVIAIQELEDAVPLCQALVDGGIPALKAFSGPFPDVTFCPTGGIRRNTAADYLSLGNVQAVGGTWLTPADVVAARDWAQITEIARGSLADL